MTVHRGFETAVGICWCRKRKSQTSESVLLRLVKLWTTDYTLPKDALPVKAARIKVPHCLLETRQIYARATPFPSDSFLELQFGFPGDSLMWLRKMQPYDVYIMLLLS